LLDNVLHAWHEELATTRSKAFCPGACRRTAWETRT